MFFRFFRFKPRKKYFLGYFGTSIVSHCNLNCKYCDHFTPLAKEKVFDVKTLKKEFERVKEIMEVGSIGIMGGEPLLHPNINEVLCMFREIFKHTRLFILTNGIKLNSMEEDFWTTCRDNKIGILISKFPLKIDFTNVFEKAKKYKIPIDYYGAAENEYKTMYKMALDLEGKQDPIDMYKRCWQNKGGCTYFEEGKFYRCTTVGNIKNFNNYFNQNLKVSKKDYLDIYKVRSIKQIYNYFNNQIDFCKHCNFKAEQSGLPFELSKKDIKEWTM